MHWPSAELELLLVRAAQAAEASQQRLALETFILPRCQPESLLSHPYHPTVLLSLLIFAEGVGIPTAELQHIGEEIRLLARPASNNAGSSPVEKIELLALKLLDVYMAGVRLPHTIWIRDAQHFFGLPALPVHGFDESLWTARFSGDVAWNQIIDLVPHLHPWRHLLLDALRRLYYTSILFWDGRAGRTGIIPVRVQATASEGHEPSAILKGHDRLRVEDSFASAMQIAAQASLNLFRRHAPRTTSTRSNALLLDFSMAENILTQVDNALRESPNHHLHDHSATLPVALAYYSRLSGRQADGPVVATGTLQQRADGAEPSVAWRWPPGKRFRRRFAYILMQKLFVAHEWLTYDRLLIPANTSRQILSVFRSAGPPRNAMPVATLEEALPLWQEQSQRVMSLAAKLHMMPISSAARAQGREPDASTASTLTEQEFADLVKEVVAVSPLPDPAMTASVNAKDGVVYLVVGVFDEASTTVRDALHERMKALAAQLQRRGMDLEALGHPDGFPRRYTRWNIAIERNSGEAPHQEQFRLVTSPKTLEGRAAFRDHSRFPF